MFNNKLKINRFQAIGGSVTMVPGDARASQITASVAK